MERFSDSKIEQVERIMALLFNATYPGKGMWRFKTACEAVARGALAEASDGDSHLSSCSWFAAAVSILKMKTKECLLDWNYYTPREQTEIAKAFLPAAKALIEWVNAIRKRDAQEHECNWEEINFMYDAPEGVILNKLGGYDDGPNLELIKKLLFTEDRRCEVVYDTLFFEQLENGLDTDGESIDYSEPEDSEDIKECNAVIRELCKNRAELEERKNDVAPLLPKRSFQEIVEDLSASNEEFREKKRKENEALCRKIDEKVLGLSLFKAGTTSSRVEKEASANVPKEERLPDGKVQEQQADGDKKCRSEKLERFMVYRYDDRIIVEDTQIGKQYGIGRPGGNAAKAVMTLIRDYAAGNRQVHDSSREWKGALQPGRGDATRFKEEQIFMLPKWSAEKQRYLNGQYCGKWRLWTDEEMKLPVAKRLANYKAEFPHGQAWDD